MKQAMVLLLAWAAFSPRAESRPVTPRRQSPGEKSCPAICDRIIGCEEGPFLTPEESCLQDCLTAYKKAASRRAYACVAKVKDCHAVALCLGQGRGAVAP
jgi:hypothetical protein